MVLWATTTTNAETSAFTKTSFARLKQRISLLVTKEKLASHGMSSFSKYISAESTSEKSAILNSSSPDTNTY